MKSSQPTKGERCNGSHLALVAVYEHRVIPNVQDVSESQSDLIFRNCEAGDYDDGQIGSADLFRMMLLHSTSIRCRIPYTLLPVSVPERSKKTYCGQTVPAR